MPDGREVEVGVGPGGAWDRGGADGGDEVGDEARGGDHRQFIALAAGEGEDVVCVRAGGGERDVIADGEEGGVLAAEIKGVSREQELDCARLPGGFIELRLRG